MQYKVRALVAGVVFAAFAILGSGVANASTTQCSNGYACMWGENTYTGCFYHQSGTGGVGSWNTCTGTSANNGANSVRAQGNSCDTRFYDLTNNTGAYLYFNRVNSGVNYQDPTLSNGGGTSAWQSENWQDRIGSIGWVC